MSLATNNDDDYEILSLSTDHVAPPPSCGVDSDVEMGLERCNNDADTKASGLDMLDLERKMMRLDESASDAGASTTSWGLEPMCKTAPAGSAASTLVTPIVSVGFVANGKPLLNLMRKYKADTLLGTIVADLVADAPLRAFQSAHVPSFLKCSQDELFRSRDWLIGIDMSLQTRLCDWAHLGLDWSRIELSDDCFCRTCDQLVVALECWTAGLHWPIWGPDDRENLTSGQKFGEWHQDPMLDTTMSELLLVEPTDKYRRETQRAGELFWIVHRQRYHQELFNLLYRNTSAQESKADTLPEPVSKTLLPRAQLQKLEETVSLLCRSCRSTGGLELRLPAVKPDTGTCNLRYTETLMLQLHKMR